MIRGKEKETNLEQTMLELVVLASVHDPRMCIMRSLLMIYFSSKNDSSIDCNVPLSQRLVIYTLYW